MLNRGKPLSPQELAEQVALAREFQEAFVYDGDNSLGGGRGVMYLRVPHGVVRWARLPLAAKEEILEKGLRKGRKWKIPLFHKDAVPAISIWMPDDW